jgi:hypothetical protein
MVFVIVRRLARRLDEKATIGVQLVIAPQKAATHSDIALTGYVAQKIEGELRVGTVSELAHQHSVGNKSCRKQFGQHNNISIAAHFAYELSDSIQIFVAVTGDDIYGQHSDI